MVPILLMLAASAARAEGDSTPAVVQHGTASYYADHLSGRETASGNRLNQNGLVAASRDLPLGSTAKVTNEATGKSVHVKVEDRGPYARGRVIDVSKRAAKALDMKKDGVAPVKVESRPADQPTRALKDRVAERAKGERRAEAR
jgi:rare lipoprotein A